MAAAAGDELVPLAREKKLLTGSTAVGSDQIPNFFLFPI